VREVLNAALWYNSLGFRVLPLNGKIPVTKNGVHDAFKERKQIIEYFSRVKCNVGIATGEVSGVSVVDVDGEKGYNSMRELSAKVGNNEWTITPTVRTARGYHLYYTNTVGIPNKVGVLPGVDVRSCGGYVVAPPSVHETGVRYKWIRRILAGNFEEFPKFLLETNGAQKKATNWRALGIYAHEGERNDRIARVAGHLLGRRVDDTLAYNLICAYNTQFVTPSLSQAEVDRTFDSVYAIEERKRNGYSRVQ